MMSSYSHRFCLGFTQCGPFLTLCLTDRGRNCTTTDVNACKTEDLSKFIQAISHFTLAPDDEVGDDRFFPTFSGSFEMTFPTILKGDPNEYLNKLIIESRLFHSFSFTGKGTQILLAKPAFTSAGQYPQHVVVKDSWPTPAETHEAYLIRHICECLTQAKAGQFHVDVKLHKHLTMMDFPDVLHKYFCQSVDPNTGELVHEATNVRRSCTVTDLNDCDVMMLQEMFEHRLRYHLVFKDIIVDSTWFASRREYLTCILHNLEGMITRHISLGPHGTHTIVQHTDSRIELHRFSTRALRLRTSGSSLITPPQRLPSQDGLARIPLSQGKHS